MRFTLPQIIAKKPKVDDYSKLNSCLENPRIKKYTEKYRLLDEECYLREKNAAEEMSKKAAEEKHAKRMNFLLQLLNAVIGGVIVLFIEHFFDIVRFIQHLFAPLN